jgi:hypothetical protein
MNGSRGLGLLFAAALAVSACASSTSTPTSTPATPTVSITLPPTPAPVTPGPTRTAAFSPTSTFSLPPADLPFTIDCGAMPADRLADCDAYIAATRDLVYPILSGMTGVTLSRCYKAMHYVILPRDPTSGVGGTSAGDTITYNALYSIDLAQRYDVHEILHSLAGCSGALDLHVFHGYILNSVYDLLGAHEAGWLTEKGVVDLRDSLDRAIRSASTSSATDVPAICRGILADDVTLAYLDLGLNGFRQLYRATIPPLRLAAEPSSLMVAIWGGRARQVLALLDALSTADAPSLDVPACGLSIA